MLASQIQSWSLNPRNYLFPVPTWHSFPNCKASSAIMFQDRNPSQTPNSSRIVANNYIINTVLQCTWRPNNAFYEGPISSSWSICSLRISARNMTSHPPSYKWPCSMSMQKKSGRWKQTDIGKERASTEWSFYQVLYQPPTITSWEAF